MNDLKLVLSTRQRYTDNTAARLRYRYSVHLSVSSCLLGSTSDGGIVHGTGSMRRPRRQEVLRGRLIARLQSVGPVVPVMAATVNRMKTNSSSIPRGIGGDGLVRWINSNWCDSRSPD